jgi:hypothetical protein
MLFNGSLAGTGATPPRTVKVRQDNSISLAKIFDTCFNLNI